MPLYSGYSLQTSRVVTESGGSDESLSLLGSGLGLQTQTSPSVSSEKKNCWELWHWVKHMEYQQQILWEWTPGCASLNHTIRVTPWKVLLPCLCNLMCLWGQSQQAGHEVGSEGKQEAQPARRCYVVFFPTLLENKTAWRSPGFCSALTM